MKNDLIALTKLRIASDILSDVQSNNKKLQLVIELLDCLIEKIEERMMK